MVEIGEPAPTSVVWKTNPNADPEREFDMTSLLNKDAVVLYFFPGAFTGVCTKSTCDLRDQFKDFSELNAELYGISVDLPFSQYEFMKQNDLNYPLLSDFNKELIRKYGVEDNSFVGFKGVAKRSLFLIKSGKVAYKWIAEVPSDYPPFDQLKSHLS